jgi:beta-galactosidase
MGVGAQHGRAVVSGEHRGTAGLALDGAPVRGTHFAEVVEAVGARVVASYTDGPAEGSPAVTRHPYGKGEAWYVTTIPDAAGLDALVGIVVKASGVEPVVEGLPPGVEVARRGDLVTLINHGAEAVQIDVKGTDAETGEPVGRRELRPQAVLFALVPVAAGAAALRVSQAEFVDAGVQDTGLQDTGVQDTGFQNAADVLATP